MASGADMRIEVVSGKAAGFSLVVNDRLVIGRQSEGAGRLADDPELSRHHAELSRTTGGFTLKDLSSTNGTFLNGDRLSAPAVLIPGDEIELGATKLVVREAPVAPAVVAPEVDVRAATVTANVPAELQAAPRPTPPSMAEPPPADPGIDTREHDPATRAVAADPPTSVSEPSNRLVLVLVLDPERGEARVTPTDGAPVILRLQDGRWRIAGGGTR